MTTLPNDYARCFGSVNDECITCLRRLAWLDDYEKRVAVVLLMQAPREYPCPKRIAVEAGK